MSTVSSHLPSTRSDWQEIVTTVGAILRDTARDAIRAAGRVTVKPGEVAGDLVTEADTRAQARLEARLSDLVPGSGFLGEEGFEGAERLGSGLSWIVDPLDGTLNFACDLPFYGMSVALVRGGAPVLGVVYDIGADCLFDAVADGPARRNGQVVTWDAARAGRAPVGISSGFLADMRADPGRFGPDWLGQRFRIFGSQAVQLCWAAEGRLCLNINREAKLWDDAAGALICARAGAAHAALACDPLYPLAPGGAALAGTSLFSIAGSPELVAKCRETFVREDTAP